MDRRRFLSATASTALFAQLATASGIASAAAAGPVAGLQRRFVRTNGRDVFYLHSGKGPPLVLLHSSPGDSAFFLRDIPELAKHYSVYAFDTPGFGRSDPLPEAQRDVSYLADAIADAMRALKLPPAMVLGSHTGAAIGTELAARQPDVVRALFLDGFPIFNQEELDGWFDEFFPLLVPDKQGGQFAPVWTRCRDQSLWFPWSYKKPDHLMGMPLAQPARIQTTMLSVMRCGRTYVPAFRSAVFYGPRAAATIARIKQPMMFTCAEGDPLSAHLDRLPALKANQNIRKLPTGAAVRALRDEWLAAHAGTATAPVIVIKSSPDAEISLHVAELADGREVFVRTAGQADKPPLLFLHDAPGSSAMHIATIRALSVHARVYAPDLPGCGETDPLSAESPSTEDYVQVVRATMDALGLKRVAVHGIGIGSIIALELARLVPARVNIVSVQSVPLPSSDERQDLLRNFAPPIELKADGSHWYATWLMLRDASIFWPWYKNTSGDALRHGDLSTSFAADKLHDRTMEVMKQYASYHHVINAAFDRDVTPMLNQAATKLVVCTDPTHIFSAYDGAVLAHRPVGPRLSMTGDERVDAAELAKLLHL